MNDGIKKDMGNFYSKYNIDNFSCFNNTQLRLILPTFLKILYTKIHSEDNKPRYFKEVASSPSLSSNNKFILCKTSLNDKLSFNAL